MAIDFPINPTVNQQHTDPVSGNRYYWTGTYWRGTFAQGTKGDKGEVGPKGEVGDKGSPVPAVSYVVTNAGTGAYLINGQGNPTISLVRGFRYEFQINSPGHPFWIKTSPGTGTTNAYNSGVTNNGTASGLITFQVPANAPDVLYYQCQVHGPMVGMFVINEAGQKGTKGDRGLQGDKGNVGSQGIKGDKGDSGDKGEQGIPGTAAFKGDKGNNGSQGIKGDKGETGDKGEIGVKGDQGIPGTAAFKGDKGEKGASGDTVAAVINGANTGILFNDSGDGNTVPGFTYNKLTNALSLTSNTFALSVNGSFGTAGQSLTSSGNGVYWGAGGRLAGAGIGSNSTHYFVDTGSSLSWTVPQTFTANVAMANSFIIAPTLKAYSEDKTVNSTTTGATTLDFSTTNVFDLTLTGNTTFTFINPPPSTRVYTATLILKQDATGGRSVTWPASRRYAGGVTPPPTTTANAVDIWTVTTYDGGTTYVVSLSVKDAR